MNIVNTPYDDVFRTLVNDCSSLMIPVINEVFGEHYTGKEKIEFCPNEHFINQQDGNEKERITDTNFRIIGKEVKKYHFECQSSKDDSMLVRFFEYDAQIALDEGEIRNHVLTVTFPNSAVLFLRCDNKTPDKMKVIIVTPGTNASYEIPVIKSQSYTIDVIFKKNLLFLIPFYIFSYEKQFEEYNYDKLKLDILKKEYENIKNKLEELMNHKIIDEYTKCTIIDMSNKVLEHIAKQYNNVREGVKSVMGGKILEYEAKAIRNEGVSQGISQGISLGKLEMLFELVQKNLLSMNDAAIQADMTREEFEKKMSEFEKQ